MMDDSCSIPQIKFAIIETKYAFYMFFFNRFVGPASQFRKLAHLITLYSSFGNLIKLKHSGHFKGHKTIPF